MFAISTLIMKRLLLTACILGLVILGNAQNYQCVKTDAVSHFECTDGRIFSIRIDSVAQRGDTADYFSYKMIRQIENIEMIYTFGDSWIGEKFSVIPGGKNAFYNRKHQEIIVNTLADLNETWQMYQSSEDGLRVTAEVILCDTMSFAGINDSVKTIKISVTDNDGLSIQNPFQNSLMVISKNYGMVNTFNFYEFPWASGSYNDNFYWFSDSLRLIGMNDPVIGWQNLTAGNIFDWQPGWEFHTTEGTTTYHGEYPWYDYTENIIRVVLSRDMIQDTIVYSIDRCYYKYTDEYGTISENRFRDTITEKYCVNHTTNLLPGEPYDFGGHVSFYFKTQNTVSESLSLFYSINGDSDTLAPVLYDGACFNTYHENLGVTFWCQGGFAQPDSIGFRYYKRGDDTWGTPFFCSELLKTSEITARQKDVLIVPNPASGEISMFVYADDVLEIFDISGQMVKEVNIYTGDNSLNISALHAGLYLFRLKHSGICKKIIVK